MAKPHWDPEAVARLKQVPFFIRPFVRRQAEAAARKAGATEVTSALLDSLKKDQHPGT
jgi:hypothetical protein